MPSATLTPPAHVQLDTLLRAAVEHGDLPNVVAAVTNHDTVLYRGAYGVEPTAIFRLASMTKPVTSVAVMMLAERGVLDIDDLVEQYLPEFAERAVIHAFNPSDASFTTRRANTPVTLRHLLTHTAGFGYDFSNATVLALCEAGQYAPRTLPLLFDPGTHWAYSCATGILGDVITQVTGQEFHHFFDTELFQPLGMTSTSYFLDEARLARLAPLSFRSDRTTTKDLSTTPHRPHVSGEGGLLGPADDYLRFLQMLLNQGEWGGRRLLSAASVRLMTSNQIGNSTVTLQPDAIPRTTRPFPMGADRDKFGLGFQLKVGEEPYLRSPGSYSWGGIFNTHFWVDPQRGIAVVLLTQLLPYYDEQVMSVLRAFEETVYRHLA